MDFIRSITVSFLSGIFEIGGGFLMWKWLREEKPIWWGIVGSIMLVVYGIIATWQTANFGRAYATYGGIFIIMSIIFAWKFDDFKPDKIDIIGAVIALIGACIIIYWPRNA